MVLVVIVVQHCIQKDQMVLEGDVDSTHLSVDGVVCSLVPRDIRVGYGLDGRQEDDEMLAKAHKTLAGPRLVCKR